MKAPEFIKIGSVYWSDEKKVIAKLKVKDKIHLAFGEQRTRETEYEVVRVSRYDTEEIYSIELRRTRG